MGKGIILMLCLLLMGSCQCGNGRYADIEGIRPQKHATEIYEQASKSVVYIKTYYANGAQTLGTGFLWNNKGHIVTCKHVVSGTKYGKVIGIFIAINKGKKNEKLIQCEILGKNKDNDVAVIKPLKEITGLVPILKPMSGVLKIGDTVYALGHPFGFEKSFSKGIVSAFRNNMDSFERPNTDDNIPNDVIQIDAAVNGGNSGGIILNEMGEVVGMASFIWGNRTNTGVTFAVPFKQISDSYDKIVKDFIIKELKINAKIKEAQDLLDKALDMKKRENAKKELMTP